MAKFGLKKQGRAWGLFHGTQTVTGGAGVMPGDAGRRADRPEETTDLPSDAQPPAYDNDAEYRNVRAALAEAQQQPALESLEAQQERERVQQEIEQRLAALESKFRKGAAVHWNPEAEEELDSLMYALNRLLRQVGLSVHHG